MGLRFKFNLVLVIIFAAGFATTGAIADRYLQEQATAVATRTARTVLDVSNIAALDPRIATTLGSQLVEMKVRAFDQSEPQTGIYADVAQRLIVARGGVRQEIAEVFAPSAGVSRLIVARWIMAGDSPARIFLVDIDYNAVTATARLALTTFLSSLAAVFFAVFFALNLMLDRMIVRPVADMAAQADAVSVGNFSIPEFKPHSKDEIGVLGIAFNRMRRSTEEAIKMLKAG